MPYNGLQLQEVGDFEALNFLPPQNLIRSTKLHLTTEPPIFCGAGMPSLFFWILHLDLCVKKNTNVPAEVLAK